MLEFSPGQFVRVSEITVIFPLPPEAPERSEGNVSVFTTKAGQNYLSNLSVKDLVDACRSD